MPKSPPPPAAPGLSEAVLEAADNAGLGLVVTLVAPELRSIYVSTEAAAILGLTVEEALRTAPLDVVAPEALDLARAQLEARREGAAPQPLTEIPIRRPDGTVVPIELGLAWVTVDGSPAIVAFLRDLRPHKRTQASLRRSEARLRALIESAPDGIVISRDRVIAYANPAASALLGFQDPEALVGRSFAEFLHEEDFAVMAERVASLEPGGPPQGPYEYRARALDGRALVVEVTSILFDDEEGPSVVGFARDVTESRRLQAQLMRADRLAALGTMAAGVAHEINNPLAFMSLGIDAVERRLEAQEPDREAIAGTLADLRHGVDRIATIVRQLRAFSRAEPSTVRAAVDLRGVLESAARMAAHEVRQYGHLETDVPDDLPAVRGESTQLEQVFLNLLLNAAHALDGGGSVGVRARLDGDDVLVTVRDDGRGIPEAELAQVFDPFFTTKPVGAGTGLGLSICHSIITSLDGSIAVDSRSGEGTAVHVRLPVARRALPRSTPPHALRRSTVGRRLRVAAVDDEPAFLRAVERLLGAEHDVRVFCDGEAAWRGLGEAAPLDLILLDVMMPGLSGMELYERLVEVRPVLAERVVFVTGGSARPPVERFLARAKRPILRKPFDADKMVSLIRRLD
ncbi:MAG TPA: PAS domain S-box protein [Sandaracinaceae bacterium LLY-WYZ-13_1]|nr:PAS domain S-box protein [Sandaracinaceae bacterium LLY-WYZ-13_1]